MNLDIIGDLAAPYALIYSNPRMIGTIIPDVVIEETATDELAITEHPVETGAAISDHAYKRPPLIEMRCGCSDAKGGVGYSREVYNQFLELQMKREPFDVFSGKRAYKNMLIQAIEQRTDRTSEFALEIVVVLKYIIITSTQQTSGGASSSGVSNDAPLTAQSYAKETMAPTDWGTQQLSSPAALGPTSSGSFGLSGPVGSGSTTPFGSLSGVHF